MSEQPKQSSETQLSVEQTAQARDFIDRHITTPPERQDDYHRSEIRRWAKNYKNFKKPMWLRRNFDDTNEFGAVVDYCVFGPEQILLGYLDIDSRSVDVVLPDAENIPQRVASFDYTIEGVGKALGVVEEAAGTAN